MPEERPKLYLETTIPSYLTAHPSRNPLTALRQRTTREWWDEKRADYELCISQIVLDEAGEGDLAYARRRLALLKEAVPLPITDGALRLAEEFVSARIVPPEAGRDALHIAVSAVYNVDYLLTWNCKHIANGRIYTRLQAACERSAFRCPVICTPETLSQEPPYEHLDGD